MTRRYNSLPFTAFSVVLGWRRLVLLALSVLLLLQPIVAGSGGGGVNVSRLPTGFSEALVAGSTLVGVADGKLLFVDVASGRILKAVGLLMKDEAHLQPFPRTSPSEVFVWTDEGEMLLTDVAGDVLYRVVIGFGRLVRAFYGYGYMYAVVDTVRGRELWIYSTLDGSWTYVAREPFNVTNARSAIVGRLVDAVLSSDGNELYVVYAPLLPPGATQFSRLVIDVLNASNGQPVPNARLVLYMPEYDFVIEERVAGGRVEVLVPAPLSSLHVYVEVGGVAYLRRYSLSIEPGRAYELVATVPGGEIATAIPSPTVQRVAVFRGPVLVADAGLGERVYAALCALNGFVVLDAGRGRVLFFDPRTGASYSDGLDDRPIACDGEGQHLAIATAAGTVYLYRVTKSGVSRVATYSMGRVIDVSVGGGLLAVATRSGVQVVSLRSLRELFRYTYPELEVETSYVYASPKNVVVLGSGGTTLVIGPITVDAPFDVRSMLPFSVTLVVVDPWGNPVPNATVYMDGELVCVTDAEGGCEVPSVTYGKHRLKIVPPPGQSLVATTEREVTVTQSGELRVVMERNAFYLTLRVVDPRSRILREPVFVKILETGNTTKLLKVAEVRYLLPRGRYTIVVWDPLQPPLYDTVRLSVDLEKDTVLEVRLPLKRYVVKIETIASDTGKPVPARVCVMDEGVCGINVVNATKGRHRISIQPLPRAYNRYLYASTTIDVDVADNTTQKIVVQRAYAILNLTLVDALTGKQLREPVTVVVGSTRFANVRSNLTTLVRTGRVRIMVLGGKLYATETKYIDVSGDVNMTLEVERRTLAVRFTVCDPFGSPVAGATIRLECSENPEVEYLAVTNDLGMASVKVAACTYTVTVGSQYYGTVRLTVNPLAKTSYDVTLPFTAIGFLYAYRTFIAIGAGVTVITAALRYVLGKISRKAKEVAGL